MSSAIAISSSETSMGSSPEAGGAAGGLCRNWSRRWMNLWILYLASVNSLPHLLQIIRRAMSAVNVRKAGRGESENDRSQHLLPYPTLNMTPTIHIPAPTIPKPSVAHQTPTPQRPKPTLRSSKPGAPNPKITTGTGSDSPDQSRNTNRRQTRGVTALATQERRQAVDFISGGIVEDGNG